MLLQLPSQEQERSDSEYDEDHNQSDEVEFDVRVEHVEFLQRGFWRLEVTVGLEAFELLALKSISGQGSCLKAIPNVGQIRDPSKVNWNGVERDEESGEEEERNGHHWSQKDSILHVHRGSNHQTHALSDEGNQQTRGKEHSVSRELHGLRREVVDDRHVDEAENRLKADFYKNLFVFHMTR